MTTMLLFLLIYIYTCTVYYSGSIMGVWLDPFHPLCSCAKVDLFDYQDAFGEAINGEKLIGSTVIDLEDGSGVCCRMLRYALHAAVRLVYTNVTSCYIMYWEYRCKPYPDVNRGMLGYILRF